MSPNHPLNQRILSRRLFVGGGMASTAVMLAGCSSGEVSKNANRTFANDAERWKQYDGGKLTFLTENTLRPLASRSWSTEVTSRS